LNGIFMARKNTKRLLAGLVFVSTASATYRLGDELLFSTETEQRVEREIAKEVYMNWSDRGEERDRKANLVERLYHDISGNWDYFEKQWKIIPWLEVEDHGEEYIASTKVVFNVITFNSNPKYNVPREEHLIHELAHAWYSSLTWKEQHQFEKEWQKISRGAYHHCETYPDQSCQPNNKPCEDFVREAATTSCYGADSFSEDVSEMVRTVYLLTKYGPAHPEMVSTFLIHVEQATAPRVLEKIALAAEYHFYSPRERDLASDLLRFQFRNSGAAQP